MLRMRHYILSKCDEAIPWINEHMELMRRTSAHDVDKRHREHFVGWFERKEKVAYAERKISDELYALSQGPHYLARVFNRCFIRDFLFRTASIEVRFSTQNSGVLVKGDDSTGNMDWYGVLKKIITVDFPVKKKSLCLSVIGTTFLPLLRTKVKGTIRINMGL
ncbi:hypothetical protein PVAP13_9KG167826 [Panicum virgatum]|uniref:Uncharacterized protein n=1 Tax=Panicum virgatum TaxID=38727 RepID=A0A8T0NJ17_PANVG|nr:hypothetical protein PVAP13_9KG167826 [Panicum virgatum]